MSTTDGRRDVPDAGSTPALPAVDPAVYRLFIDRAPTALAMLDSQMTYLAASRRWLTLHGLDAVEVLGRNHFDLFPERADRWRAIQRRCLESVSEHADEERFTRADGTELWLQRTIHSWPDSRGGLGGLLIHVHDVTAQKQAEAAAFEATEALRAHVTSSDFLSRVAADLLRARDPLTMLADVCREAMPLVKADLFLNYGLDHESGRMHLRAFGGIPPDRARGVESLAVGECVCSDAAHDDAPVVIEDATDPAEPRAMFVRTFGVRAYAVHPLRVGGRVVGTLSFGAVTRPRFTPDELHLMRTVTDLMALGLERARAGAALQASEARYRGLAEQIQDGIFVTDTHGRLLDANQAACAMFGFTLPDLQTLTLDDLLVDGQPPWLTDPCVTRAPAAAPRVEWSFRRKDCSTFVGEVVGRDLPDGRRQGVVRDVTHRKDAEQAIRRLESQHLEDAATLRALLSTTAQGILSVDDTGVIRSANPALEAMLGFAPGTLAGQPHAVLIPENERLAHARHQAGYWEAPRPRPMGVGANLVARKADGTTLPVEISLAPISTTYGQAVFAFVSDVSERRRAEDERASYARALEHHANRLRELVSQLTLADQRAREDLSRVLHDGLQQLLFSVKLRVDRALRALDGESDPREALGQARHDLDDAIAAARSLAVELAPPLLHDAGLPAALQWLAGWVREKYGVAVDVTAAPEANPAARDVRTLVFVSVRELLFNVVKHAGVDRVLVELAITRGGWLRVTIADQGVGFDPEAVLNSSRQRAGLGLVSVQERLTLMGGRLDIASGPGLGTRLTLLVPTGAEAAPVPEEAPSAGARTSSPGGPTGTVPAAARRALRVLVADGHVLVRDGLRDLLAGHAELELVGEAVDGADVLAKARALEPDVVLIDVSMPGGSGVEATRRLRAERPSIEIVALSTDPRPEGGHLIESAGASAYFTKGDDPRALLDQLLAAARRRHRSPG